jgi:hypothetical protein
VCDEDSTTYAAAIETAEEFGLRHCTEAEYFERNAERMRNPAFRAQGLLGGPASLPDRGGHPQPDG